jgi:hypothetical protein
MNQFVLVCCMMNEHKIATSMSYDIAIGPLRKKCVLLVYGSCHELFNQSTGGGGAGHAPYLHYFRPWHYLPYSSGKITEKRKSGRP